MSKNKLSGSRRRLLLGSSAAVATTSISMPIFAQSLPPLKLGFLNSFSKSLAAIGQANLNGLNLYLERQGGKLAGRKIVVIREDDEINPQVALQKLRRLVESEQCEVLMGLQASNVAVASIDFIRRNPRLMICTGAGTTALSYIKVPHFFRVSTSTYQTNYAMGEWLHVNVAQEAAVIASDFAGGRDTIREFKAGFEGAGGKIIKEIYPPLNTSDYSVYLAELRAISPAVTYAFFAGSDAARFVRQFDELGLKKSLKLASAGFMVEADVLPAQGRSAIGILNSQHYSETLDSPENAEFVAAYQSRYHAPPNVYAEYGFVGGRFLHEALKQTGGNTAELGPLIAGIEKTAFAAPRGQVSIDPGTHSIVHDIYLREVAEVDGRIANKVLATIATASRDPAQPS